MRALSVNKFWEMRPKMPFRFTTNFYTGFKSINNGILKYCVTNITLPKFEGQAGEGNVYLGNMIYTTPLWNVASRKLDITFEETDNMLVSRFIDLLNSNSYGKTPWKITIVINQFEEHMRYSKATGYICHLSSYEEPGFKRDGAAQQLTINASFIVDTIIENWTSKDIVTGSVKQEENSKYNYELNTLKYNDQNEIFKFGNFDITDDPDVLRAIVNDRTGENEKYMELREEFLAEVEFNENDTEADKIRKTADWMINKGYVSENSKHLCATSVSVIHALVYGVEEYNTEGGRSGSGKDWEGDKYYNKIDENLTSSDVESRVNDLKPGESITVTIDKGANEIGHVVIISKDENGNVTSVSDFNQTNKTLGWKTYKDNQNMKFKVFSDPKKLSPPEPPPPQEYYKYIERDKARREAYARVLPELKKNNN